MVFAFITKDKENVFVVSLKAGFSSFCKLVKLGKIFWLDRNNIKYYANKNIYLIVRNPYNRFLSFYNEKFIVPYNNTHIQVENNIKNNEQLCQKLIYKYHNKEDIFNMNFKLSDLIECIKKGYKDYEKDNIVESHFAKQINTLKYIKTNNKINIIKFEDDDFNEKIKNIIGISFPHENNNKSNKIKHNLTKESKDFIYDYYKEDFETFCYSPDII